MDKKKILIIKLGALGDIVHTTVMASAIKLSHLDWEVHFMAQRGLHSILDSHPHIDKVIIWEKSQRKSFIYFTELIKLLFKERYDIILNPTSAIRNILMSVFACPKKVRHKKNYKGPWVENYFKIAKSAVKDLSMPDRLYLGVVDSAKEKIQNIIKEYPKPYFVITPGGASDFTRQGRIWNIEKWKNLTNILVEKYGGTVFVCGDKNEQQYHKQLEDDNVIVYSGEFSLPESSALLSMADLVISGDTGPLHIASAHNVKTLALLGSTSPDKIKPYGKNGYYFSSNYNCKYCWKKKCKKLKENEKYTPCMESITPEMVITKITNENII